MGDIDERIEQLGRGSRRIAGVRCRSTNTDVERTSLTKIANHLLIYSGGPLFGLLLITFEHVSYKQVQCMKT